MPRDWSRAHYYRGGVRERVRETGLFPPPEYRVFDGVVRLVNDDGAWAGSRSERRWSALLVSLLEHRVQVLADSGINARVKPGTWDQVVEIVLAGIRQGDLCQGLCDAVDRCGEILAQEFPIQPDDVNELPDRLHKD